jgi:hypothetical protein
LHNPAKSCGNTPSKSLPHCLSSIMSSGQFEDAPEDDTLDSAIPADSFVASNGANTALPLPGSTNATGTGTRARQSGVGYIDEVEEASRSPSSNLDEGEVSFQRLHLGSQVSNEPVPSEDEEPVDLSGEDEENYDVEIDDEDWEVADSGKRATISHLHHNLTSPCCRLFRLHQAIQSHATTESCSIHLSSPTSSSKCRCRTSSFLRCIIFFKHYQPSKTRTSSSLRSLIRS